MDSALILLVDDDPLLLEALPHTIDLRMSNVEVHTASSASAAFELLKQHDYSTVVSDIKMPGQDGFDVLAFVSQEFPDVPVLLITGHGEHDLAIQALRGGAYDYIQKPIDRDDFIASLSRALHTHRLRREVNAQQEALELYALSLERQVTQRLRAQQEANVTVEKMLKELLHDLNTPLAQLRRAANQVELQISSSMEKETLHQSLANMEHALYQLEELISSVRNVASLQNSNRVHESIQR